MLSECIYKVLMASGVVTSSDACDLSGAIEAAVLEELAKQKPAYTFHLDSTVAAYLRGECVSKEGDPLYAAPVVQEKQEPVAWMHWYKYYDGTDVVKVAIGHAPTFNDRSPFRSEPLYAAPVVQDNPESAMSRYLRYMEGVKEPDPVERLRFFCSIAMNGRDWIDSEQFFADLAPVVQPDMVMVPREPSVEHLNSIAMRHRHDFGLLLPFQQENLRSFARQMYEECTGQGFFKIAAAEKEQK